MKKFTTTLLLAFAPWLCALNYNAYVGPHFQYTRVDFNNPAHIEGYQAGVSAGIATNWCQYLFSLDFEGSWDAGPITGRPCQRSRLSEYFLALRAGWSANWCGYCVRPYIGFGWDRFENRRDPGAANLLYRFDKLFIPLGFTIERQLCSWCLGLQFEWRPDVWSNLAVINIDMQPDWGYGLRVQLPCRTALRCFSVELVPFFDWNRFGSSSVRNSAGATLTIPRLSRLNGGLRALLGYTF